MITSAELIRCIKKYNSNVDENIIKKAYIFAFDAHGPQKRASGEIYFTHPIEVAKILVDMRLDTASIAAGLLHDVIEDTNVSLDQIEEQFGIEIAILVDNLTKINKIKYNSTTEYYADNFRKFLIATAVDLRVLLIKLADRLHNLRTILFIPNEVKRKRIALESIDIYAPLATFLGPQIIKDEIEDISFNILHPNEYKIINEKLHGVLKLDSNYIQQVLEEFKIHLDKYNMHYKLSGRLKTPYSIWRKIRDGNFTLDQIHDIFAFRVIVDSVLDCYKIIGIAHTHYPIIPGRFKDYISIPKMNNYKSLHTTLIGPKQRIIELQVRTQEMHENAEYGIAAHFSYKNGEKIAKQKDSYIKFLTNLVSVVKNSENDDVIHHAKIDLYDNKVFCFSKDRDVINLPKGASVIDFAYHIHTYIGNTCIGAKVNGSMVAVKTVLQNGDQVEIITSSYQKPEPKWLQYAVTGKARMCIKKFILSQEKSEFIALGCMLAKYFFSENKIDFSESKLPISSYYCDNYADFYFNLAKGKIPIEHLNLYLSKLPQEEITENNQIYILKFIPDIAVHYSNCCHPILNDRIIGILEKDKGLVIHNSSCDQINYSSSNFINLLWNEQTNINTIFIARVRVILYNKLGALAKLSNSMYENNSDITNIKIEYRSHDFIDLVVEFKAENTQHLNETLAILRMNEIVSSVHKM